MPADKVRTPVGPGDVTGTGNVAPWCVASLAVNPKAGRVWAASRRYVQSYKDELLEVDADARVRARVPLDLGDDGQGVPYHVTADARADKVWVTFLRQAVYRYGPDRKPDLRLDLKALACVADEGTGGAWVVTDDEVLRVDARGEVARRAKQVKVARTAWVALD